MDWGATEYWVSQHTVSSPFNKKKRKSSHALYIRGTEMWLFIMFWLELILTVCWSGSPCQSTRQRQYYCHNPFSIWIWPAEVTPLLPQQALLILSADRILGLMKGVKTEASQVIFPSSGPAAPRVLELWTPENVLWHRKHMASVSLFEPPLPTIPLAGVPEHS